MKTGATMKSFLIPVYPADLGYGAAPTLAQDAPGIAG